MLIKYLVTKDLICTHKSNRDPYPPDIAIKLLDQRRLKNNPEKAIKPSDIPQTEIREFDLTYFPKYLRSKADWLLKHLTKNGIRWNSTGEIFYNDQVVPGSHILELVNDALRERKRSNPTGWQVFALILKELNVPRNIVQNKRRIIITPSKGDAPTPSQHRPGPTPRRITFPGEVLPFGDVEEREEEQQQQQEQEGEDRADEEFVPAYEQLYP